MNLSCCSAGVRGLTSFTAVLRLFLLFLKPAQLVPVLI